YVQATTSKVTKKGETLEITIEDQPAATTRLSDVSQLVLMGNVYVTTPCLHELMRREIPVTWLSYGGWFLGHSVGLGHKNVELRTAQYKASFDPRACLHIARQIVHAKIMNCRTLIRRNWRGDDRPDVLVSDLKLDANRSLTASGIQELLGIEGASASRYFRSFARLLETDASEEGKYAFDFTRRNRRPPHDPVNALLSFACSLLMRTWSVTRSAVGFDLYRWSYHQPRYGRPALALDMMEPFRPLVADSTVLTAINNGEVKPNDFVVAGSSVALTAEGRKKFIGTFERRLSQEVTHPLFGYKVSYRQLFELQARLLGRHLLGELTQYPSFITR